MRRYIASSAVLSAKRLSWRFNFWDLFVHHKLILAMWLTLLAGSINASSVDKAGREMDRANPDHIEEVLVWGRALKQKGEAQSASSGLVGYSDFRTRPLQRVGELVEVVPGMVATQHSGEGKANQYYLRGMNLDHGTDFSAYFAGMPINLRAHAHGQGYLDLNFLIPEVVSTVVFKKGPYSADRGDFSTAGTTSLNVYERIEEPFVQLELGEHSFQRLVAAGSRDVGNGHLLAAVEVAQDNGPWELSCDIEKHNALLRYNTSFDEFTTDLIVTFYDNSWIATDQIPQRAVDTGAIDRFGFIDPSLGGTSQRLNLISNVESEYLDINAYISQYALNVFGNFTYFADDPINGDQIEQVDRRWIYGGSGILRLKPWANLSARLGLDLRADRISKANLYQTTDRTRRIRRRRDAIDWDSFGVFGELTAQWNPRLRSTFGVRLDHHTFDVDAQLAANSDKDNDTLVTPSISIAFELNNATELYASWGAGFHSNDVRGVTIQIDPATLQPAASVDLFARQSGAEMGMRFEHPSFNGTASYFWLKSASELLFAGDSGATEPNDGSDRTGLELSAFWQMKSAWTADVQATWVDSKFTDVPPNQQNIPNTYGRVAGAGLTYTRSPDGITASLRARHFGDASLVEDNSVTQDATTIINAGLSYRWPKLELGVEILNLLDSDGDDIAYFFESQLQGELEPVADVHFHPVLARTFRLSAKRML